MLTLLVKGMTIKHYLSHSNMCYMYPGEKHGYHPVTFGLYLDQLVRRADPKHRSLSQYFQDEIAVPFGRSSYFVEHAFFSHTLNKCFKSIELVKHIYVKKLLYYNSCPVCENNKSLNPYKIKIVGHATT